MRHGRLQPAQLVEDRMAFADEPPSQLEVPGHRVEQTEWIQCQGDRHRAVADLLADLLAAPDRHGHRRRPEHGR